MKSDKIKQLRQIPIHINKYLPSHIFTKFIPLLPLTYIHQGI
jgi:hypothetical protein